MTDEEPFSYNDGVICKYCNRLFHFGQVSNLIEGLTFPKGDFSLIRAKCPNCYNVRTYNSDEVKRSGSNEDSELIKELRNTIAQLEIDKKVLTNRLEDCMKLILNNVAQTKASPIENQTSEEEIKKQNGDGIYG